VASVCDPGSRLPALSIWIIGYTEYVDDVTVVPYVCGDCAVSVSYHRILAHGFQALVSNSCAARMCRIEKNSSVLVRSLGTGQRRGWRSDLGRRCSLEIEVSMGGNVELQFQVRSL
jgi:hypothetical protein